ncbi:MAG: YARHG domain-containing protein [Myxococcaceae bacterium]
MHALVLVGFLLTSAPDAGNSARPLEFQRKVTDTDLQGRSLYELALMRNYPFARAHNVFRKSWLRKYFADQGFSPEGLDEGLLDEPGPSNAEKIAAYEAALTREQLLALRDRARKAPASKERDLELRLLSERLGEWAGEGEKPKDLSPLEDPAKLDSLLTLEQLDDFSPRDLKLLRNTIFARRGRAFVTPMLKAHFATVAWYKADPAYADSRLTNADKKNVALILGLEKKLGGTTVPDETKERWYGRA